MKNLFRKKLEIHYDFAAMAVICFALSAGFNVYLLHQYNLLFTRHIDLQWEAQNHKANHAYAKRLLEACEKKLAK